VTGPSMLARRLGEPDREDEGSVEESDLGGPQDARALDEPRLVDGHEVDGFAKPP
jgi:hypothetical protein